MSIEEAIAEIRESQMLREVQPELKTIDKECLIRALTTAEDAAEFAYEVLARHDSEFGRRLRRHKENAEYLERRIEMAKKVVDELRQSLGWPERVWRA